MQHLPAAGTCHLDWLLTCTEPGHARSSSTCPCSSCTLTRGARQRPTHQLPAGDSWSGDRPTCTAASTEETLPAQARQHRKARAGLQTLPVHRQATACVLPASRRCPLNRSASRHGGPTLVCWAFMRSSGAAQKSAACPCLPEPVQTWLQPKFATCQETHTVLCWSWLGAGCRQGMANQSNPSTTPACWSGLHAPGCSPCR